MVTEDLTVFLSDFGVSVTAGAVSGLGILDMPGVEVLDGNVISTGYTLTCRSDEFGWMGYSDLVNVESIGYRVQERMPIGDGKFCKLLIEKVGADTPVQFVFDGDFE